MSKAGWLLEDLLLIGSTTNRKALLSMKEQEQDTETAPQRGQVLESLQVVSRHIRMENMLEFAVIILWLQLGCKLEVQE